MPATASGHEDLSSKTDEELARKAATGHMPYFEEIVRRRRSGLVRFLASYFKEKADAEDVAQDAFVRAYRNLHRYNPNKPFLTWLYVIARRLALNHLRKVSRSKEGTLPEGTEEPSAPESHDPDFSSLWASAGRLLSPDAYAALRLHYAEARSVKEIAEVLGKSLTATKVLLFRARRRLAENLNPMTFELIVKD